MRARAWDATTTTTHLLDDGQQAAVVHRQATQQELARAQHLRQLPIRACARRNASSPARPPPRVAIRLASRNGRRTAVLTLEPLQRLRDEDFDLAPLVARAQVHVGQRRHVGLAAPLREGERDHRQQAALLQKVDEADPMRPLLLTTTRSSERSHDAADSHEQRPAHAYVPCRTGADTDLLLGGPLHARRARGEAVAATAAAGRPQRRCTGGGLLLRASFRQHRLGVAGTRSRPPARCDEHRVSEVQHGGVPERPTRVPVIQELATRVHNLVEFLVDVQVVLERNGALQRTDDVDLALLGAAAPPSGAWNWQIRRQAPRVLCYQLRRPWSYPTQSANSTVFGTVADRRMMPTCAGSMMITSSQTTPRCRPRRRQTDAARVNVSGKHVRRRAACHRTAAAPLGR